MGQLDYEQFEKDWKKRHKASLPRKMSVSSKAAIFWISFWLMVAAGAAIFSAAHTIPAAEMTLFETIPFREWMAVTAFIIVELVVFGAAAKRHEIKWLIWLLICALLVAFIGNTSSSYQAVAENGGNWLNQVGGFLLSIIAPITALAAGEVLHIQLTALAQRQKDANEDYQRQWKEVDAKINSAFTKLEKEAKVQLEAVNSLNLIKNNEKTAREKPSPRLQKAIDWLEQNPDKLDTAPRDLELSVGVSYGTIWKAQQYLKQSPNGHAKEDYSEN